MARNGHASFCIIRQDVYPDGHVSRDAEALVQAGNQVTVIALRHPGQPWRECLNGVEVYRVPLQHQRGSLLRYVWEYSAFFVLAAGLVTALHVRRAFQVVEIDNLPDVLVFSAFVPRLLGARIILYIFDNMPELLMVTRGLSQRHPAVRLLGQLQRISATFAQHVIVPNEATRCLVASRGVGAEKITVVLNCPDERVFQDAPGHAETRPSAGFEIVTHGTILERFGIQVLLEAMPRILSAIPDARVRIVGRGEYRAKLEALARRRGIHDRVEFQDWVPPERLPGLLRQAHVGYVGMLCDLMLSNKLMEYVALGIPAVVAQWPAYAPYFPEDTVRYFTPGNPEAVAAAVIAIHRDPADARARADRARALYQEYRWRVQRDRYLGVYRAELMAATRVAHPVLQDSVPE